MGIYLTLAEKPESRALWEEIFTEDSQTYLDVYDKYKLSGNKVLVHREEDEIVSMLQLNPYQVSMYGSLLQSYYIIAVATKPEYRHKGLMRSLLTESLNDMNQEGVPFTFLIPAKKEIYLPFDFTFIYDKPVYSVKLQANSELKLQAAAIGSTQETEKASIATSKDWEQLALFSNDVLAGKYDIFCHRTGDYFEALQALMQGDNGDLIVVRSGDKIIGYYTYWPDENGWEITDMLYREEFSEIFWESLEKKPSVMARIVNLEACLKAVRTQETVERMFKLTDPIIEENNGIFYWKTSQNNAVWRRVEQSTLQAAELSRANHNDADKKILRDIHGDISQSVPGDILLETLTISELTSLVLAQAGVCINEIV